MVGNFVDFVLMSKYGRRRKRDRIEEWMAASKAQAAHEHRRCFCKVKPFSLLCFWCVGRREQRIFWRQRNKRYSFLSLEHRIQRPFFQKMPSSLSNTREKRGQSVIIGWQQPTAVDSLPNIRFRSEILYPFAVSLFPLVCRLLTVFTLLYTNTFTAKIENSAQYFICRLSRRERTVHGPPVTSGLLGTGGLSSHAENRDKLFHAFLVFQLHMLWYSPPGFASLPFDLCSCFTLLVHP